MEGCIPEAGLRRAKILSDILNTVSTLNEYYNAAPTLHQDPMQRVIMDDRIGIRPGTRTRKMTPEEEDQLLKDMAEDDAAELQTLEAETKAGSEAYYAAKTD